MGCLGWLLAGGSFSTLVLHCTMFKRYSYETEGAGILFLLSAILESLWCMSPVFMKMAVGVLAQ